MSLNISRFAFAFFICVCAMSLLAGNKVIYGDDDRIDLFQSDNPFHVNLAQSVAAQIPNRKLEQDGDSFKVSVTSLVSARGICETEKFANQPIAPKCSGFLIAPDLLVTAGHCVATRQDCYENKWVFDYSMNSMDQDLTSIPASKVYGCKEIISNEFSLVMDYALIRLDRSVTDRDFLQIRSSGIIDSQAELLIIGHPSGLPLKIASGANVRNNKSDSFFVANLDSFGGNSGSPVIDPYSGIVEGILVSGEKDYVYDFDKRCRTVKVCEMDECCGESVTRITAIKFPME